VHVPETTPFPEGNMSRKKRKDKGKFKLKDKICYKKGVIMKAKKWMKSKY
jgi:hypothetical protein